MDFEEKRTESRLECSNLNLIASVSNFLPTGFVVHFVVDRVRTVSDRWQYSNLLFLVFMFDILDVDTAKSVYEHTEAFMEISRGNS